MRIVILADPVDDQYAGIHVYTTHLIAALAQANDRHEYVLIRSKWCPEIPGARTVAVPGVPGLAAVRRFFLIPWIIRRMRADCVIEPAHFGPWNLPGRIKRITFIHDMTPVLFPQYHPWRSHALQRLFLPRIARNAAWIVTNSQHTADDVAALYSFARDKIVANPLGKDPLFRPTVDPGVLSLYGVEPPYFLCVGTIEPRKNLETLLEAYALFREHAQTAAQLVIAGKAGWKTGAFFERLRRHPYRQGIRLTGYVPSRHLPTLYTMAHAFVYPSWYEGFGLPVVEAMGCGAPCILSCASSLPETGGDAALYAPPDSPEAFSENMIALYRDSVLRQHLIQAGKRQAARFTWEAHAARFNRLFAEIERASAPPDR